MSSLLRREAGKALFAENLRALAPGHQTVGGSGIGGGAGQDLVRVVFTETPVDVAPAAGRGQCYHAAITAGGQAFNWCDGKIFGHGFIGQRAVEAGACHGLPRHGRLTCSAGRTDEECRVHVPALFSNRGARGQTPATNGQWGASSRLQRTPAARCLILLAGLPAPGFRVSPVITHLPDDASVALGNLSGNGRGRGCAWVGPFGQACHIPS